MIKIIKNIVTILLIMNIFTSAVGINIHMHRCNTSNTTMVSVFETHCNSHDTCSTNHNCSNENCDNCDVNYHNSNCCVDDFERKSIDIETISSNSIEIKSPVKIEFAKIIPNIDDIDTDNKFKQYHKLPRDIIFSCEKIVFLKTLKISTTSDDDLIS